MKVLKFTGLVLLIIWGTARVMAQAPMRVKLSNPAKPYKLNVELVLGTIRISAYSGKEILIDADVQPPEKSQEAAPAGMKRLSKPEATSLTAQENNNEVNVSDRSGKLVNLTIKVPANAASIRLKTTRGDINVDDISSAFEIQSNVGAINVLNVSGSVVANTDRGKLLVTFKAIDPKAAMAFSTFVGDVDITFPAGLRANLKIKTEVGQAFSDFDMADDPSHSKPAPSEKNGKYQLTNDGWIYGKVAGGGPEILLKNTRGNIYIHRAK
ncbi:DUF4097 family beta strand repeat-containing protein [Mucilaginibacter ximonensis]|uniref:DUF4097 family beta strand repeat-containing protein n=1 Tax=Mucilaginibacter ximonensis TaxID=538021 RepID=A0ABW5YBQ7_9SPHI